MMKAIRSKRSISTFCLLVVMLLLASSTKVAFADESEEVSDLDQATEIETEKAEAAAAAAAAAKKKAKEIEEARFKAEKEAKAKEETRIKAEKEAKAKEEAARLKREKEAEEAMKAKGRGIASVKDKISGVTDVVFKKSQSIIENAKSMTGKQRKQALAFVAATGFGGAFLLGGKAAPAADVKGRGR